MKNMIGTWGRMGRITALTLWAGAVMMLVVGGVGGAARADCPNPVDYNFDSFKPIADADADRKLEAITTIQAKVDEWMKCTPGGDAMTATIKGWKVKSYATGDKYDPTTSSYKTGTTEYSSIYAMEIELKFTGSSDGMTFAQAATYGDFTNWLKRFWATESESLK